MNIPDRLLPIMFDNLFDPQTSSPIRQLSQLSKALNFLSPFSYTNPKVYQLGRNEESHRLWYFKSSIFLVWYDSIKSYDQL